MRPRQQVSARHRRSSRGRSRRKDPGLPGAAAPRAGSASLPTPASASGEFVVFADADLSAGTPEIERCFHLLEVGRCDVVATTRGAPLSNIVVHQPPLRQLSGKLFNVLVRVLGLTRLADTQCGLKGFTREAANDLFRDLRTTRFAFDVEILLRADQYGMVIRDYRSSGSTSKPAGFDR